MHLFAILGVVFVILIVGAYFALKTKENAKLKAAVVTDVTKEAATLEADVKK